MNSVNTACDRAVQSNLTLRQNDKTIISWFFFPHNYTTWWYFVPKQPGWKNAGLAHDCDVGCSFWRSNSQWGLPFLNILCIHSSGLDLKWQQILLVCFTFCSYTLFAQLAIYVLLLNQSMSTLQTISDGRSYFRVKNAHPFQNTLGLEL